jgi:hypothetical protein
VRIDRYLGEGSREPSFDRGPSRDRGFDRGPARDRGFDRGPARDRGFDRGPARERGGAEVGVRMPLEKLRDEARTISQDAPGMDPAELRLRIEAVTAETRALQNRASDPEDNDIAAKILRAMTAVVSEHRPGHVYGLARHHEADWDEIGRRARQDLAEGAHDSAPDAQD